MGLFGAVDVGVTSLQAQSNALGIISQNISNASTTGYKEGVANFSELVTDNSANNFSVNGNGSSFDGYLPSGVLSGDTQYNALQGTIVAGNALTNVAISGSGFFPVTQSATSSASDMLYTRVGSFTPNQNGDLVNANGFYLQGWPIDSTNALATDLAAPDVNASTGLSALQPVNVNQADENAVPTTAVSIQANLLASQTTAPITATVQANLLSTQAAYTGMPDYNPLSGTANMASGSVTPQFTTPYNIVDSKGVTHNVTIGYLKTTGNDWAVEMYTQPASDVAASNGQIAYGNIGFNNDGSVASVSPGIASFSVPWQDGADTSNMTFNWGAEGQLNGITQQSSPYALTSLQLQPYDPTLSSADMASGAVQPQFDTSVAVIDNTGVQHSLTASFVKTSVNTWGIELYANPPTDVTAPGGQVAFGTATFNGDGTMASISPTLTQPLTITWTNQAAPSTVSIAWGTAGAPAGTPGATTIGESDGLSQFDSGYNVQDVHQNGIVPGSLTDIAITTNGYVTGTYSNGTVRNLYALPLADFSNADQLRSISGDVFSQTADSGNPLFNTAGQGGAGTLDINSLESSNVDMSAQLTNMIVAQSAYQSSSKLISTSDSMLTNLIQMGAT